MTLPVLAGLGIALAATIAALRIGPRRPVLLVLQFAAAGLLYFTLFPPKVEREVQSLVIATAGTTPALLAAHGVGAKVLALPEAPMLADVERIPDLATALRRAAPGTPLRILGAGLVPRDVEAARSRALVFHPTALPRGFVEVSAPAQVTVGTRWSMTGAINDIADANVELIDPSGAVAMQSRADAKGRFRLEGTASAPGRMRYDLRVRDGKGRVVESLELPMQAVDGAKPRVLILAGGPSPELKYLRRWATDAGVELRTQVSLGGGLRLGEAPVAFDASTLQGFDLLVLDERAWRDLGDARRRVLRDAVADGLGVLLRITAPLPNGELAQLRGYGFDMRADDSPTTVVMANGIEDLPTLTRQSLRLASTDAQSLLEDASGKPLAAWRNLGRGRMGVWWLGDSFRLVLSGHAPRHGRAWSEAFTTLSRAKAAAVPSVLDADPRVQQRMVLCGLQAGASVIDAQGEVATLVVDLDSGSKQCAAYWPSVAGWHRVRSGSATMDWIVRDIHAAPGLWARRLREETQRLVSAEGTAPVVSKTSSPGPRWPWFVAWLLASGLGWWLERRGLRRVRAADAGA
ncbi:MAG: carboxypeptidase regulatory-like domain-containing protein [Gammaproteobacteria bacterium]|nr:carboxypeptidase regulatory-like domain-containing protein [Gammaproteobacteria bacterium]